MVLEQQRFNPAFKFLCEPSSADHAYYRWKVQQLSRPQSCPASQEDAKGVSEEEWCAILQKLSSAKPSICSACDVALRSAVDLPAAKRCQN